MKRRFNAPYAPFSQIRLIYKLTQQGRKRGVRGA